MIYIRTIFSIIISLFLLLNTVYAYDPIPNGGNFILAGKDAGNNLNTENLVSTVDDALGDGFTTILQVLYGIGVLVALCAFAFMGIQFITSSPTQKAQLKAGLTPFFVGLLLFVAGVPIAIFIINIFIKLL